MDTIDWKSLPFGYFKTNYNVRCYYRNGKWGELEITDSENISMHMAATCLHYGQEAFEGMKAFTGADGKIRIFRPYENAKRMNTSARGIMMAEVPEELFVKACVKVAELNKEFIPPYGSGASFYFRPLLIGTGPQVGVKPADEYLFVVFGGPVGPYFKEGFNPVKFQIVHDADRAAPFGTGKIKVGGNYAASLQSGHRAHVEGYANCIYLDPATHSFIDEVGAANFFGIKNNTYVTPASSSILPSITNLSLCALAEDMGLKVEKRAIPIAELSEFTECAACGTAAVISPIGAINDRESGKTYNFGTEAGPVSKKLYETLRGIQEGTVEDKFGWNMVIE